MDIFDYAIPTFEHINKYRERAGLEPYPTKPLQADFRIRNAFDRIKAADTVVLLTVDEVNDIITQALNEE